MKNILIIDNRGKTYHPYLEHYPFIKFYEQCNCLENINLDDFQIAIVHSGNIKESFWAKNNFKQVIIISGDFENPTDVRGQGKIFNIPREIYKRFACNIFDYYKNKNKI